MEKTLNLFLADLATLAKKVQNFHWNIKGKSFFSIHEQLDKMYSDLNEVVDEVAERILALNGRPLSTMKSCLLYTSPSPRDRTRSRMPSSA